MLRALLTILFLTAAAGFLQAQEVASEKAVIRISNIPAAAPVEIPDNDPPSLEFISPPLVPGVRFQTDLPEMDLIGKVTDVSGISFVSIDSEIRPVTQTGIFSRRLVLKPGDNRIRVVSMDLRENMMETTILVTYVPPVISLAEQISSRATYYGLIIGIDTYRDMEIPDLANPVKDAEKLYTTLADHYTFERHNIRLLKNATRADIISSLDELAQTVTPEDNLLIFYAGHGWWDEIASNGYWLPSDAHRNVKTNWLFNSTLVDYLKEINSRHTLLIADACFGGSIFKTRSAFGSPDKAYEKLYELPSRKAMTSGTLTEVPDRSSFTRFLIQRLTENAEPYLSSEELFSSFRLAVINNSDAIPQYGEIEKVGDQGGDFIFLRKNWNGQ